MVWINTTGGFSHVIDGITTNVTGDLMGTYLFILILIFVSCMMFRIPLILAALISFPFVIVVTAYLSSFIVVLIILIVYISAILARFFWLN